MEVALCKAPQRSSRVSCAPFLLQSSPAAALSAGHSLHHSNRDCLYVRPLGHSSHATSRSPAGTTHILVHVAANDEEERGIPPVDDLHASVLHERALMLSPGQALANDLCFQGGPLLNGLPVIVRCQPCLALLVHHENELDAHSDLQRWQREAGAGEQGATCGGKCELMQKT